MARYYNVISADGHLETQPDPWVKYVPEKWRARAPRLVRLPEGGEGWVVEGQPFLRNGKNITGRGPIRFDRGSYFKADGSPNDGAGGPLQRLREQDEDGIDAELLFPPVYATRFLEGIGDRDVYCSMIRAYNTWLAHDYCSTAPDRLIGAAALPVAGVEAAVAEVRFAHEAGLRAVSFNVFPNGSGLAAPEDDRFWETCVELGIAVTPHFGFGELRAPIVGGAAGSAGRSYASALAERAGAHPPVYCMAQLMAAGVFDRFPEITFYFAETNASWLPSTMYFMNDNHDIYAPTYERRMPLTPREYIEKHCHFSIIRDAMAVELADKIPIDNIMWGSDFPHAVGSFPTSQQFLAEAFAGQDELRRKVTLENPARFLGLDLETPITETPVAA